MLQGWCCGMGGNKDQSGTSGSCQCLWLGIPELGLNLPALCIWSRNTGEGKCAAGPEEQAWLARSPTVLGMESEGQVIHQHPRGAHPLGRGHCCPHGGEAP